MAERFAREFVRLQLRRLQQLFGTWQPGNDSRFAVSKGGGCPGAETRNRFHLGDKVSSVQTPPCVHHASIVMSNRAATE
jgi:hypothetical protein